MTKGRLSGAQPVNCVICGTAPKLADIGHQLGQPASTAPTTGPLSIPAGAPRLTRRSEKFFPYAVFACEAGRLPAARAIVSPVPGSAAQPSSQFGKASISVPSTVSEVTCCPTDTCGVMFSAK